MKKIAIVMGLQYGSEAKGSICAGLAKNWKPDTVATAWGPNAGHTVRDGDLHFVSSMLATGMLYPSVRTGLIGPGSVVDFVKLAQEVERAGERLHGKYLIIHPQAAFLKPEHAEQERELLRIGSTMKGTMQAAIGKMHRVETAIVRGAKNLYRDPLLMVASKVGLQVSFSEKLYDAAVDGSEKMVVEGAQGYSLGIHGQFYPYCTSRDVSVCQTMADCRLPHPDNSQETAVIGVLRTYPIRVANRRSDDGQEYTSGGIYEDQHELDWRTDLGREPELTTVTKLPRRIFTFSHEQIYKAIRQLKPTALSLTFCDYLEDRPQENGGDPLHLGPKVKKFVDSLMDTALSTNHVSCIDTVSYGPDIADIFNVKTGNGLLDRNIFNYDGKDYEYR